MSKDWIRAYIGVDHVEGIVELDETMVADYLGLLVSMLH